MTQNDLFADAPRNPTESVAKLNRDLGISRARGRADRDAHQWTERAVAYLVNYARTIAAGQPFLVEDAREVSRGAIEAPKNPRAWGAVVQVAEARGLIVHCGFKRARSSNMGPKSLWRAA